MPVFVPILRCSMLFLNIYESYKTLKLPPPSTRDPTRPSLRATTQRKRDMKGCLAVWIVWCCFITYECLIEGLVSLFIPFYDEFKSMALLFLILTRAKGAEPIFLHILRPLIRPYTTTLDTTLEVLVMTGDFIFALASFPIDVAIKWWQNQFYFGFEVPESDSDAASQVSNIDEVGSNTLRPRAPLPSSDPTAGSAEGQRSVPHAVDFPSKANQQIRRGSVETLRSSTLTVAAGATEQTGTNISRTTFFQSTERSSRHEIWRPPPSSYEDEDMKGINSSPEAKGSDISDDGSTGVLELTREEKEVEEWRQYPPFPSAYPPTPLVTTSRLVTTTASVASHLYPPIAEETIQSRQDFSRSLKLPRKPLNPGYVNDLSDQNDLTLGIPRLGSLAGTSTTAVETENDSISDDDYIDEEDSFNTTLRTPLPMYSTLRPRIAARALPLSAVTSQSTAINSVDTASSLRTRTSSESPSLSPSDAASSAMEPSDQQASSNRVMSTIRQLDVNMDRQNQTGRPDSKGPRKAPIKKRKVSRSQTAEEVIISETDAGPNSWSSSSEVAEVYVPGGPKAPAVMKRRRIAPTPRKVGSSNSKAVKPRAARRATSPSTRRLQPPGIQSAGARLGGSSAPVVIAGTRKSSRLQGPNHAAGSKRFSGDAGPVTSPPKGTEFEEEIAQGSSSGASNLAERRMGLGRRTATQQTEA